MGLPCERESLAQLGLEAVTNAILVRRTDIRGHRDAKGDDRCWLDDFLVWRHVEGTEPEPDAIGDPDRFLAVCERFWAYRNAEHADAVPADAIADPRRWDDDLMGMDYDGLVRELARIQMVIKVHSVIPRSRPLTAEDDRCLYRVLPENLPADFRLPPRGRFLGRDAYPRAGCPAFADSHTFCGVDRHDLHHWGTCSPRTAD